jgi:hypothetical protein
MTFVPTLAANVRVWHSAAVPATTNLALKFGSHFYKSLQDKFHRFLVLLSTVRTFLDAVRPLVIPVERFSAASANNTN